MQKASIKLFLQLILAKQDHHTAQQCLTHELLLKVLRKEKLMVQKIDQAMADFDQAIAAISTEISDLVARLADAPPGADANAIADQIEAKLAALKTVTDPLKQVAVASGDSTPPVASPDPSPTNPNPVPPTDNVKDPITGVVTDPAGNVLTNPVDPAAPADPAVPLRLLQP